MHYKTREKLKKANKLYTVEPEDAKAIEIKVQLPSNEYVRFFLNEPFPSKVYYHRLEHGGFNYDPQIDTPITRYSGKETVRILKNSIGYRSNNTDTIDKLIEVIKDMEFYELI